MHPLAPDLTTLSENDLQEKMSDLQNKLMFAYRMGHTDLIGQMHLLMADYQYELQLRNQRMMDDLQQNNKGFSDTINIAK